MKEQGKGAGKWRNNIQRNRFKPLMWLPIAIMGLMIGACASLGRPEGGPRDEQPPMFVSSSPKQGELNVKRQKLRLTFDENVTVKDVMTKVVVSPAQKDMPVITANGHTVSVELRDSLIDSMTYTIDFADAISDLNEGNILDGFSFAFSTGPTIDTLAISGMVLEARTLEPAQGMMVGVYSNLSDTAITTLPMERITKTNQLGQFTLRNLKPGTYRIYAVDDVNRDYHWDKSENIAFYDVTISPSSEPYERTDTLLDRNGEDSLVTVAATKFLPNDVLLTWFNLNYKPQYLAKYERQDRHKIYLETGAPSDSIPQLRIIGGPADGRKMESWAIVNSSATMDTVELWITDSTIIALDSLRIETRYKKTDSLEQIVWQTDTLNFNIRKNKKGKDDSQASNKREKKNKKDKEEENDSTEKAPKVDYLDVTWGGSNAQELNRPYSIQFKEPVAEFNTGMMGLEMKTKKDTVWRKVNDWTIMQPDSLKPMQWELTTEWKPDATYKLTGDSAAIKGIYGRPSEKVSKEFTTKALEEYSTVYFNITGTEGRPAMVELLSKDDKPVATAAVDSTGRAELKYLAPGQYYARMYIDSNGNGKYDVGIVDSIQPEETAYFTKKINLKKNWDLEQSWNIYDTALDMQKHKDIKKNKPKLKPGETEQNNGDEEEEDEFNTGFGNQQNQNRGFGNTLNTGRGGSQRLQNNRTGNGGNGLLR